MILRDSGGLHTYIKINTEHRSILSFIWQMLIHCLLIWPYSRSKEFNSNQKAHAPSPRGAKSLCNIHKIISSLMIAVWVHLYFDLWVEKILLEKEMAIHCSILAWKIPYTEEPGRLQLHESKSWTKLSMSNDGQRVLWKQRARDSISKNYIL